MTDIRKAIKGRNRIRKIFTGKLVRSFPTLPSFGYLLHNKSVNHATFSCI